MTQTEIGAAGADTPALRMFGLLELIAAQDRFVSLQSLTEQSGLPKPTVHRMLAQLEAAQLLVRQGDGRQYGTGHRLRAFAEDLLLNATQYGARHAVLRELVDELGEACNITALSGDEVIYLDRVETPEPLRFHLRPGSRVPVHCSASGKMLLSQMRPAQRRRLLGHAQLAPVTPRTVTDVDKLEEEVKQIRRDGYALDEEEFLPGLFCVAVLVPTTGATSNQCVAVQAPTIRLRRDGVERVLSALRAAALKISAIENEGVAEPGSAARERTA